MHTRGTAEIIHATSACLQEIRQRNIMFQLSENTFCYISYHGALWGSSNYCNLPKRQRKSICGETQDPLLQVLSIVFPYQMQNVPHQRVSWEMTLHVFLFVISLLLSWSSSHFCLLWKSTECELLLTKPHCFCADEKLMINNCLLHVWVTLEVCDKETKHEWNAVFCSAQRIKIKQHKNKKR